MKRAILLLQRFHAPAVVIAAVFCAVLVAWLTYKAIYQFGPSWQHDYPSYHLPFILRDFNMTTWMLWPNLLPIWEGYPPLGHNIQALLAIVTGDVAFANAIGLVSVLVLAGAMFYLGMAQLLPLVLAAYFAIPLFLLNFPTGGLDIWFSVGVLIQFMCLTRILQGDQRPGIHALYIGMAYVVVNSKANGWAITLAFAVVYGILQLYQVRTDLLRTALRLVALALAVGFFPTRNWLLMGSPAWPFAAPWFMQIGPLVGTPSSEFFSPAVRPDFLADTPNPLRYLMSFFEITRVTTEERMSWTFSQWAGGAQSKHQLMGGLNGAYMVFCALVFLILIIAKRVPVWSLALLCLAVAVASIMPQSHEMRYSLYVPMILLFLIVFHVGPAWRVAFLAASLVFFGIAVATPDISGDVPASNEAGLFSTNKQVLAMYPEIGDFWASARANHVEGNAALCIPETDSKWYLADPLGVYFTGRDLNSLEVKVCRSECSLPWQGCQLEW